MDEYLRFENAKFCSTIVISEIFCSQPVFITVF